jgi:hypothetical protein
MASDKPYPSYESLLAEHGYDAAWKLFRQNASEADINNRLTTLGLKEQLRRTAEDQELDGDIAVRHLRWEEELIRQSRRSHLVGIQALHDRLVEIILTR